MEKEMFNSIVKKMKASLFLFSLMFTIVLSARENVGSSGGGGHRNNGNNNVMSAQCIAGSTQQEILLNDVRTRVLTDGDMWWDFTASVSRYEVPKGSNSYAEFAGSLWFGGYENGNVLHTACMTYRQNGVDFWPGPINPTTLSTDIATCQAYDKVWTFNRADVANFYAYWNEYGTADPNTPLWIKDYPGNTSYPGYTVSIPPPTVGNPLSADLPAAISPMNYFAPYVDVNSDGMYNYASGDYPAYHLQTNIPIKRGLCVRYLFGDQTLFYVFNDEGNKHGETNGDAIGVEIRGQAFEFSTNDQLNDMTFYNYEIINWSTNALDKTYITIWDDCDLGDYQDDMVGCDVSRGLGYQYNGENYDYDVGGQTGYHDKLPAIGCDFFQGPYADTSDGIDNDRDGCIDCSWSQCSNGTYSCQPAIPDYSLPEQITMSRFTYYNNTGDPEIGNPDSPGKPFQYYNYMNGVWKNGTPMTYGNTGTVAGGTPCTFLFPGITDPLGWGLGYHPSGYRATSSPGVPVPPPGGTAAYGTSGWTQYQGGLPFNDMRFLMSAGVFTLLPGAVNYVTFGIPFVRSTQANYLAPIPLLYAADDKAQALFDNCFKVLDGPDAPNLTIQELDRQLLFTITNNPYTSNNYEARRYADFDPSIVLPNNPTGDNIYRFQGYIVYQLQDNTVGVTDLANPSLARQVFQCDIKDGVKQLINYIPDPTLGLVPTLMVTGADAGIQNSFSITQDLFSSTSDNRVVNFKNYYFMAIAYAYNNYLTYVPNVPPTQNGAISVDPKTGDYNGQQKPFLQGRNNVQVYTAIPHNPSPENYGTVMNSAYGSGPAVTRIEGQGNGGFVLDITDTSVNRLLNQTQNAGSLTSNSSRLQTVSYVPGGGPVLVKVIDPLRIVKGNFTVKVVTATSQPNGSGVSWYYNGNPPTAGPATLDTGRVKNLTTMKWFMTGTYTDVNGNNVTKTWLSDEGLSVAQEKIITGLNNESLGFSVTMQQCNDPNMTAKTVNSVGYPYQGQATSADLLQSTLTFAGTPWLSGVQDQDANPDQDWIISGNNTNSAQGNINNNSTNGYKQPETLFGDPSEIWEGVLGGTWAPFRMVNPSPTFPNPGTNFPGLSGGGYLSAPLSSEGWGDTRLLSSVDIVFTSNDANWTRCPVIDMNTAVDPHTGNSTSGLPYKWQLRRAPSVDKHGLHTGQSGFNSTDGLLTADSSMGWFPGYAINVETGERLNIIFAENSADSINNGRDMIWNPTSALLNATGNPVFGGMHYIYICGHNSDGNFTIGSETVPSDVRRYDAGLSTYEMLTGPVASGVPLWPRDYGSTTAMPVNQKKNKWALLAELFKDIMWCSMPLSSANIQDPHNIPGDAKVRIRVPKPFRYGLSTVTPPSNTSYTVPLTSSLATPGTFSFTPLNSDLAINVPYDVVAKPQNGNFPMYTFNTNNLAASTYQLGTAQSALAKINIVPNPYYSHSAYEQNRIDLEVKIINLPQTCTIKIYSLAGTLVNTITKNNSDTYVTWNLNNSSNIQIASGLYILHIDCPGIGERILKWFGVLRPYDLQSF